ncbi:hypothetical protein CEE37_09825 [candidate division LCP-89 bacterium B3_LCP]|uniref:Uncharacterized protein n=1 Tax=candidate division LCP-89 bacterium B3_LCP TaxID=2012998 RepID=A0A532UYJ6_UNCL8|nr:MAG: hypothetical protein CEE37_09825 [candidate division LCP-89 bacterium B3_LCP]
MKRAPESHEVAESPSVILVAVYIVLSAFALTWAIGCSKGSSGGPIGGVQYSLNLSISPTSVYADTGTGMVSCFLTSDGLALDGKPIEFRAASEPTSNSTLTSSSVSLFSNANGLQGNVFYHPNDYVGDTDTIFAAAFSDFLGGDTLIWTSTVVNIIHP